MHFGSLSTAAALISLLQNTAFAANPKTCSQDACLRKVASNSKPCLGFFQTTIIPAPTATRTRTTSLTTTLVSTHVVTETRKTTVTSPSSTVTTIIFATTKTKSITSKTTVPPSNIPSTQGRLAKRAKADAATTRSATVVPPYASAACANTKIYSSACSCVGAIHSTITVTSPTRTLTSTKSFKTSSTISSTSTVTTSITEFGPVVTTTQTSTTTTTVAIATATKTCTSVVGNESGGRQLTYGVYYAGQGYTEATNNPGNVIFSPQTTTFTDPGPDDACAALATCASYAANSAQFLSIDLHFLESQATWVCVAYYNSNTDPSYFNVANSDVSQGYGYSV